MDRQKQAYLYAVLAMLLWATVASAFKITLRHLSFIHMLLYSSLVSTMVLYLVIVFQGKGGLVRAMTKEQWLQSAALGFLNPFLYYLILFKAYELLPAQEAQALNYTWPIMIVLFSSVVLSQRLTIRKITAILLGFGGVLIIATHGDPFSLRFSDAAGAALAVGSSLVWALFWLFNVRDPRDEVVKLFTNFCFGALFVATSAFVAEPPRVPCVVALSGAAYIGLFEMGITYVFWLKALSLSRSAALVSNLVYASPFLSLFLIRTIVGEIILPSTLVGLALIVAGIVIQQSQKSID